MGKSMVSPGATIPGAMPIRRVYSIRVSTCDRQAPIADHEPRIVSCPLPVKAPWLNRIEPKWVHAMRAIVEPARERSTEEIKHRVCNHFGCQPGPDLKQAA